ncbi:hypothetical protein [Seonamhaeicola maritimus]|uniref:hypothetical protein n=1 Tax=Seonamhaeicola maritimus TaxID=2591822 RepID=UPI002494D04E|nr:hypothetical protein [Seonamhaeicola maritimus]
MHGSLGHFKALVQRHKARKEKTESRFEKRKRNTKRGGEKLDFNFPKLRESELKRLKKKIRTNIQRDNFIDYLLFAILFLFLFISFYYFMN